jgi:hypothetical protein
MCAVSVSGSRRLCDDAAMLALRQTGWCRSCQRVQLRLTKPGRRSAWMGAEWPHRLELDSGGQGL